MAVLAPPPPPAARARIKAAAERLAVGGGLAAACRVRMRGGALVLAYHGVIPHGEPPAGERSLHVPQRRFAEHLDVLLRTHDVVPLPDVLRPGANGRPRVALTFDDAYGGALTAGVAELAARGLPATFFVVPGRVDGDAFWWDALVPPGADGLPAAFRARALEGAAGDADAVREMGARGGLRPHPLPAYARPGSMDELRAAARVPGITFGAHGWSHRNLARCAGAELRHELRAPLAWLRARFPASTLPWLAWPYGCVPAEGGRAAAEAGYAAALRVEGGWMRPGADPFALPRVNVPAGLSPRGLALRAAGLLCG